MNTRSMLVAALAPLMFACTTVGPDYRVPDAAVIQSPDANGALMGSTHPAVAIAPVPDDWWQLYDDQRLDALVKQALAANTDIRVASANLRRAIAMYHEVAAESLPQGGVKASAERAQLSGEQFLLEEKLPAINLGDVGLSVSYLVDIFGKLRRADEAALAGAEASQAALDLARVTVVAETVRAYVNGCAATHEYDVASAQLALQERGVDLTRKLVDAGREQPTDLLRAQAQADTLRAALPRFRAAQEGSGFRLAALLGKPPGSLDPESFACHEEPHLTQALPVGDGAALLKRRPDIRQAERELAAATAKIGVATADLYPSIRIGASAGFSGVLEHLGQSRTAHWGMGPLISWSLPTNGIRSHIRGVEAGADAALAHFDGVVLKALEETQTALSSYTRELERMETLRAARDKANEVARQNRLLYQAGRTPYLSSLDADRTLANAEATLAASEARVAGNQVSLFLALGGGWKAAGADDPLVHPQHDQHTPRAPQDQGSTVAEVSRPAPAHTVH